jgi:hypothetical protein
MAFEESRVLHEQASLREQAMRALMRLAGTTLREAEQRQEAIAVLAELIGMRNAAEGERRRELAELVDLATPGTALWDLPEFGPDGYKGLGQPAVSLGLTASERGLVVIRAEGHDEPYNWLRLNPSVVLTVAQARDRWWVVDAEGANLVSGGAADRERMERLRDEKHPGCRVQQGREFIGASS